MSFRVFLLSPARTSGKRAELIFSDRARFELALRIRRSEGVPVGEVFAFLSGLYFRGKLSYATTFARPPAGVPRALVITTNRGLVDARQTVTLADLRAFADVDIHQDEARYTEPLERDARELAARLGPKGEAVLLGSLATPKYCEPLRRVLGDRLRFPIEFAGRGDMSRGGLMLRCTDALDELAYVSLAEGTRHGKRPARLAPRASSPRGRK